MTEVAQAAMFPLVAVAVDKDRSSQGALKWALDNAITKGQTVILLHVIAKPSSKMAVAKEVLFPFRCFCKRKNIECMDIVLEDTDVAKAIVNFVAHNAIEKLILGTSRGGFVRSFRSVDIGSNISKSLPDFCTVCIINKGKVSSIKNAVRPAPAVSPLRTQIRSQASTVTGPADLQNLHGKKGIICDRHTKLLMMRVCKLYLVSLPKEIKIFHFVRSPFNRRGTYYQSTRFDGDMVSSSDISFVSSSRQSTNHAFPDRMPYASDALDFSFESESPRKSIGACSAGTAFDSLSLDSFVSESSEYMEIEMNRLKLELKQTMDMYSAACKEALTAKQKAMEFRRWKAEEEQRAEEARIAEEAALALAEKEKSKCKAAMEAAEAARRIAEMEARKRLEAEMRVLRQSGEKKAHDSFPQADMSLSYRKYTIEEIEQATDYFAENRKIGEGGYGPVFKCYLDHTPVAVKVLRPDAAHGQSQFQQEVQILSRIRHPNMVLLLGACPEFGCLAYEYMANGSLEDRLLMRGNTPSIPWQDRFRIAAEIGTGLLFLHQTKPEPLVHRDLKPANILLDQNYTSKISDVGLARLVPPSMANSVTQYHMTSTAGTFCYIDPEYQQTGMLGTKSDVYSLGVLLLQMITGKSPMGLTHLVEHSIERGKFAEVLDPTVHDWPIEEALCLAKIALKCTELRRKDRPDLGTVILPELNRLRAIGAINMQQMEMVHLHGNNFHTLATQSQVSLQDLRSGPLQLQSGYESSSQYSGPTFYGT
ncbi:U-box domain-containing protein 52-like [Canna indica]|uniref:RING-type E3 ubiquitin transferase n=1 Tax=Canna indica TaxID=4628 RepID=A0AAQ3JS27_9LILI|nr:U-box domain-containing protein 52-like [Canna indica]